MKKLGKLEINQQKLLKEDELIKLKGGTFCGSGWLGYYCTCWSCLGCLPTGGNACIPQYENPDAWAAEHGNYELCTCIGGY